MENYKLEETETYKLIYKKSIITDNDLESLIIDAADELTNLRTLILSHLNGPRFVRDRGCYVLLRKRQFRKKRDY